MMATHQPRKTAHPIPLCTLFTAAALTLIFGCHGGPDARRTAEPIALGAAAVLDRYVEVTGGLEAYAAIHNRISKVRVVHVGMGLEDHAIEYEARPNKRRSYSKSEAFGTIQSGVDGTLVWFVCEETGPVIEEGEAKDAAIAAAAFDRSAQWRKHYKEAKHIGEEVVGARPCHKLVLTPNVGKPETRFYDKDTGLLVKIVKTQLTSVGTRPTTPVEVLVEDYRPVGGLQIPYKVTQTVDMCGSTHETIYYVESIRHNVELPPDQFDPPEEVRAFAKDPARSNRTGKPGGKPGCKPATRPVKREAAEDDSTRP